MLLGLASLLVWVPAVLSTIEVKVILKTLNKNAVNLHVSESGHAQNTIDECHQTKFQLSDEKIKEAVSNEKVPESIHFNDPSPGNKYAKNQWVPVTQNLRVHKSMVLGLRSEQTVLETKKIKTTSTTTAIHIAPTSTSITLTSLFENATCIIPTNITVDFTLTTVAHARYILEYGKYQVRPIIGLLALFPPSGTVTNEYGQVLEASAIAIKYTLDLAIEYQIYLGGDIYCHHSQSDWKHTVKSVQDKLKLPNSLWVKQNMTIEFLHQIDTVVRDEKTRTLLQFRKFPMITTTTETTSTTTGEDTSVSLKSSFGLVLVLSQLCLLSAM